MARYRDLDKINPLGAPYTVGVVREYLLSTLPEEEVAPVVHSQWEDLGVIDEEGNHVYKCRNCHGIDIKHPKTNVKYCWNCGAIMDEEVDDD